MRAYFNTYVVWFLVISGCVENLRFVCSRFTELYYSSSGLPPHSLPPAVPPANEGPNELHIVLNEWDYVPNIGSRPSGGYVGLKNAGATCYMNSVLQQVCFVSPRICFLFRTSIDLRLCFAVAGYNLSTSVLSVHIRVIFLYIDLFVYCYRLSHFTFIAINIRLYS